MAPMDFGAVGIMVQGATRDLASLEISAVQLTSGKSYPEEKSDYERWVIIKSGQLKVKLNGTNQSLGAGSVVVIYPEDQVQLSNQGNDSAVFYLFLLKSRHEEASEKEAKLSGSFAKNWDDIAFKPHDKGGIRNFFDQPTAEIKRFEMHVTTLKGMIKSHEPHTHRAAEFVLMIKGKTEMEIGDGLFQGQTGDLYFLGSEVSHAIRNTQSEDCMYFAFQFE